MRLLIVALGAAAAWLVSGTGLLLPMVAVAATILAGMTAGPLIRSARANSFTPRLADFPPLALTVHSASLILLLALILAGFILP